MDKQVVSGFKFFLVGHHNDTEFALDESSLLSIECHMNHCPLLRLLLLSKKLYYSGWHNGIVVEALAENYIKIDVVTSTSFF